jgi:hypothetical protein
MTFRAANTPVLGTGTTAVGTVPAGTVATDFVLVVTGWGLGTASTVTLTAPAGAVITTLIPSRNDTNLGWALHKITGLVAGNTVTSTMSLSCNKVQAMYGFTTDFGAVGTVGNRNGVSQTTTPAPALMIPSGQSMLIFGIERTTADGTTGAATVATGEAVTQLAYNEQTADPDLTFYLGRFVAASSTPGIATITYNSAATNGAAVQIIEVAPAISPSFGIPGGVFTTEVEIPPSDGTFRWWDETSGTWQYIRAPQGLSGPQGQQGDASPARSSPGYTVMKATSTNPPDGSVWGYGNWVIDAAQSYPAADRCVENPSINDCFRFRRAGIAVINIYNQLSSGWLVSQNSIAWLTRGQDANANNARIASCCFDNGEAVGGYTAMARVAVGDVYMPLFQKWANNSYAWNGILRVGLLAG